jgi:ATP-binding cassette subfamily F protein 3
MLRISGLTYRIAGRTLLEDAAMNLSGGERAGLVGRNGSGKSTLLKLIAGSLQPDAGEIALPASWRVGMLAQEAPGGSESLLETVLAADRERTRLLAEAESAADPDRIAAIHARLVDIEAHRAPSRAGAILAGLGFDAAAQARPCSDFSGGWRMRVALAALLFTAPDLLLLDEPTNHLDLEASIWLEGHLRSYPGTLLLVSHDRDLLNRAVERIVHLDHTKLTVYGGNYDRFERTRSERLSLLAANAAKQAAQRRHMQAFIDRFRYKASKARQAQSRIKALARLEPILLPREEAATAFSFPAPEPLAPPMLTLEAVSAGYAADRPVLHRIDLRLDMDDRVALLGANGNGKSTIMKLLAGRLAPLSGELWRSPKLRTGYFAQHQQEELDPSRSPLQHLLRASPEAREETMRAHLARFGLDVERAGTPVAELSGGEKARLLFALMSRGAPNLLLLDEPTNHLDIDAREALVQALNEFAGAVVLVSHDPHLIELVADRLWLVAEGRCTPFEGDVDDYRRLLLEQERGRTGGPTGPSGATSGRKDKRRAAAENRAQSAPLRRAAEAAAKRLESLQRELARLERRLADPALYTGPSEAVTALQIESAELRKQLAEAEEGWLAAEMALEAGAAAD